MQTIQLQIEDDIYDELKSKGIDINHKLQDFLYDLLDDGYPAISEDEAKQRVSNAVDRYRNGTGVYTAYDKKFTNEMEEYIQCQVQSKNVPKCSAKVHHLLTPIC